MNERERIIQDIAEKLLAEVGSEAVAMEMAEVEFEDTYSLVDGKWQKTGAIVSLPQDF